MNTETLVNQVNLLNSLVLALENEKATLQSQSQKLHIEFNLLTADHEKVVVESTHLRQKNQQLFDAIVTLNKKLRNYQEIQENLVQKYNETTFLKIQYQKCQNIIAKNNETISQLSIKKHELERALQTKTREYTQRINDFEINKLPQLVSQNQLKDIKITGLNQELKQRRREISELSLSFMKQTQVYQEQKLVSKKGICELSQKYNEIKKSNELRQTIQKNTQEIAEQFMKKENLLKQKLAIFEKQINRLQEQLRSIKIINLVQEQQKVQKDKLLNTLKKIITDQEKHITQQKIAAEKMTQILFQKDKEIENLQTNNSMLRKQVLNALANQDSTRKEMIMQKQQLRKTNLSTTQLPKRNAHFLRKRLTALTQKIDASLWQDQDIRRSEVNVVFTSQKNVDGSIKEKITVPSEEGDYSQV